MAAPVVSPARAVRLLAIQAAVLAALLLIGAGIICARWLGQRDAQAAQQRLELLWPDLMQMPVPDRAILAGLGMTCRLHLRAKVASEVVACLREAAASSDPMLPKGVDPQVASGRLDALIAIASMRGQPSSPRGKTEEGGPGGPKAHGD